MNIAIVGANSFLSQALLDLVGPDTKVIQVYHERKDRLSENFSKLHIATFLEKKPIVDCIFYIASYINFEENSTALDQLYATNVGLLKRISETFKDAKIIHTSSVSVYENSEKVITEKSTINPKNSYGLSKLWAELLVKNHKGGGVNVRISSLFGEGMNQDTFLPKIIQNAISKKQIVLYGDGTRKQNYVYVREVAEILFKAMKLEKSDPLLAVGSRSYSNLEIAVMIKAIFLDTDVIHDGADNSASYFYDHTQTNKLLDIQVSDNFKEQLRNTALWIQRRS